MSDDTKPSEQSVLGYLNLLRDTGCVNMYRAAPYLERDMGLTRREAEVYLTRYMRSTVRGEFTR